MLPPEEQSLSTEKNSRSDFWRSAEARFLRRTCVGSQRRGAESGRPQPRGGWGWGRHQGRLPGGDRQRRMVFKHLACQEAALCPEMVYSATAATGSTSRPQRRATDDSGPLQIVRSGRVAANPHREIYKSLPIYVEFMTLWRNEVRPIRRACTLASRAGRKSKKTCIARGLTAFCLMRQQSA
jgi:hypothetical protein